MSNIVIPQRKPFARPGVMSTWEWALEFDGVDDYVRVGNPANMPVGNSSRTIDLWVYSKSHEPPNNTMLFWGTPEVAQQACLMLLRLGDRLGFHFWGNDLQVQPINLSNSWYHLAFVYDNSKSGEHNRFIYLDGNLLISDEAAMPNTSDTDVWFGAMGDERFYEGLMKEVRIWDTPRTQQQIQDSMNKKLAGDETGLVGYWPMDKIHGTIYDHSGNDNHGTIVGATWVPFAGGQHMRRPML